MLVDVEQLDLIVIAAIFIATTSVAVVYTTRYLKQGKPIEIIHHEVEPRVVVREAISKSDFEDQAISLRLIDSRVEIERIKREVDSLLKEVEDSEGGDKEST